MQVSATSLLRHWHSTHPCLGISPSRRPSLLVCSSPLPATLAGRLTPPSQRRFRIRVVTQGISNGFVAAFRHRRSPPDLLLPGPHNLPFGLSFGALRVFPWSHAAPCGATQAFEVSLAFSLDPEPFGFRFGVRAIPAVMNPRFLPGCFASRIDPPSASPLLPRIFPRASFAFFPCGLPAALAQSDGISPSCLPALAVQSEIDPPATPSKPGLRLSSQTASSDVALKSTSNRSSDIASSSFALEATSDLHRISHSPAPPSNPTSGSRRISNLQPRHRTNFRLSSET